MSPEMFRELVKSWRASINPRYRSRTKAPNVDIKFPPRIERMYAKFLSKIYAAYTAPLFERLNGVLASLKRSDARNDAYDQLDLLFDDLEKWDIKVFEEYSDPAIYGGNYSGVAANVGAIGWDAAQYNTGIWKKAFEFGIPSYLFDNEPYIEKALDNWTKLNATLIDGDITGFFSKSQATIRNAVQTGARSEDVIKDLMAMNEKLTRNRAKFIARDQIGTLQATINSERAKSLDLLLYVWKTSMDERVRGRPMGKWEYTDHSHWLMEGKLCRQDDQTVYSEDGGRTWKSRSDLHAVVTNRANTKTGSRGTPGKAGKAGKSKVATAPMVGPGIEANCRCGQRVFLDNLIAELDSELAAVGM